MLVIFVSAILVVGCVAPFINAARFSGSIRRALEVSLGRKVEFSEVYFTLFAGPGFSLEKVTISEDPRYGLEPFAYVPTLKARIRLDKLLFGQIRFSSLRLLDPSLNLVKRADGTWNVVALVTRLTAPSRSPLSFFPAFEVSDGRLDFKFGNRKTTLYIADSDLTIYPEHSGKIYIEFSGSPARTDRAGTEFGHVRGSLDWFFHQPDGRANRVEGDVILDASDLSELTTLIEGHDVGVHGSVDAKAHIEGPVDNLQIAGELHLEDVHRWDLLPSSGEDWHIHYTGSADLPAQRLALDTVAPRAGETTPVALQVRVKDFLARSEWSVFAQLNKAPLEDLLPLAKRMGFTIPQRADMKGSLVGAIGYSNISGVQGGVAITDAIATLPNILPLRTALAHVTITADRIHIDPAIIQTSAGGTLQAGGDYYFSAPRVDAYLQASAFPIGPLKETIAEWFDTAPAFAALTDGEVTGELSYEHMLVPDIAGGAPPAAWSGQFQFADASLTLPGVAVPLLQSEGWVTFDPDRFDLEHFSAQLGSETLKAGYRYTRPAKRPEHIHIEMPAATLAQIESALDPALEPQGLLARLRFRRRSIPDWLASRNLEGDLSIDQFSIGQISLGPLSSHFVWQGASLQFVSLQVNLPAGLIRANGNVSLLSYSPRLRFHASIADFPWGGGLITAQGGAETTGLGADGLRNLRSSGTFEGQNIQLGSTDAFDQLSGAYDFSFADGWPDLRLSKLEGSQNDDTWSGQGASNSDGQLVVDLTGSGRQLHLVTSLVPEPPTSPLPGNAVTER